MFCFKGHRGEDLMNAFFYSALLLTIASPAFADAVPRYDVASYCQTVSDVSGGSAMIYNGCVDMEQIAYNGLKARWGSIPSRVRSYCDEVGRVSGGSYSILEGCIAMETEAANGTSTFKY
jgi:hypothetical protein